MLIPLSKADGKQCWWQTVSCQEMADAFSEMKRGYRGRQREFEVWGKEFRFGRREQWLSWSVWGRKKEEKKLGKKSDVRGGGGGGRSMGGWWRRVSPQLADEMLHTEERSLSPATTNKARVLMGAAAIKMRGANESTERKREKWNYSSMVQITAGRLSGPSAITIMTTWCDMIVTALKENHSPRLGKR